jgi:hypothetical protein
MQVRREKEFPRKKSVRESTPRMHWDAPAPPQAKSKPAGRSAKSWHETRKIVAACGQFVLMGCVFLQPACDGLRHALNLSSFQNYRRMAVESSSGASIHGRGNQDYRVLAFLFAVLDPPHNHREYRRGNRLPFSRRLCAQMAKFRDARHGRDSYIAADPERSIATHDDRVHVASPNPCVAGLPTHCGVRVRGRIPWQGFNICERS